MDTKMIFHTLLLVLVGYVICTFYPAPGAMLRSKIGV